MMFTTALVKKPAESLAKGITKAQLGLPDFDRAMHQHQKYIEALQACGLKVIQLDASPAFPDSVFIEDVALCTPHCAIITRPGALSRRGEIKEVTEPLKNHFKDVLQITSPGTIEAGEMMMTGSHFFIGLSERTNAHGAGQMIEFLEHFGMTGSTVELHEMLHLKSGVSYLENNNLLVGGEFTKHPAFAAFNRIQVPPEEAYAANSLWINGKVLTPMGFSLTKAKIEALGYQVIEVDVSEFQKLDGGLSCLSLRF